jgi:hypothetical protein
MTFLANSDNLLPKPAGVIALSPLLDVTGSFLPTGKDSGLDWLASHRTRRFIPKPSGLWPPSTPRWGFYTDIPLHPLVIAGCRCDKC